MSLWNRQILAIMRIDLAKTFFARRGLWRVQKSESATRQRTLAD